MPKYNYSYAKLVVFTHHLESNSDRSVDFHIPFPWCEQRSWGGNWKGEKPSIHSLSRRCFTRSSGQSTSELETSRNPSWLFGQRLLREGRLRLAHPWCPCTPTRRRSRLCRWRSRRSTALSAWPKRSSSRAARRPLRFWVVDHSGSMAAADGARLAPRPGGGFKVVPSTRWEELRDVVYMQAQLALSLDSRMDVHLLNPTNSGARQFMSLGLQHSNCPSPAGPRDPPRTSTPPWRPAPRAPPRSRRPCRRSTASSRGSRRP